MESATMIELKNHNRKITQKGTKIPSKIVSKNETATLGFDQKNKGNYHKPIKRQNIDNYIKDCNILEKNTDRDGLSKLLKNKDVKFRKIKEVKLSKKFADPNFSVNICKANNYGILDDYHKNKQLYKCMDNQDAGRPSSQSEYFVNKKLKKRNTSICFFKNRYFIGKDNFHYSISNPPYLLTQFKEANYTSYQQSKCNSLKKSSNQKWMMGKRKYSEFHEEIHCTSEGRHYTVSIAVPASILLETCLLHELRTYVIGQIARASCIFSVDEIIIYDDKCWRRNIENEECINDSIGMMKMILEYQECPQYLRKRLFPRHHYMRKAGVLNALNAPHHLLSNQWCTYREGIVSEKIHGKVSYVDVGLWNDVEVDQKLEPGQRVTIKFPPETKSMRKLYGSVVSAEEPRKTGGLYWGYKVRIAQSLSEVFVGDCIKEYDLIIGTSDRGDPIHELKLQSYSHSLIVFGGVSGLEEAMRADEGIRETNPRSLFSYYLNVCPDQQSRTIRTEEAIIITLAALSKSLKSYGKSNPL